MANTLKISLKKLNDRAKTPTYGSLFAAGADLYSASPDTEILPGQTKPIGTGIALAIPEGFVGLIYARSGLSVKNGLAPANKVGVIDSDYRGEIIVALYNHGSLSQTVKTGDRIAQIVFTPYFVGDFVNTDSLPPSDRDKGGFGSTGK